MPSERYRVGAEPEVGDDLRELAAVDERLVDAAITLMLQLRTNRWRGDDLFERYNLRSIKDCRKIRLDVEGWEDKGPSMNRWSDWAVDSWMPGDALERSNSSAIASIEGGGWRREADARTIRYSWTGPQPRYRIVYRSEPIDGAPGLVRVWSVGPRAGLVAYARAAARITRAEARRRRRR